MAICLTKESKEQAFVEYLEKIFCKPEIAGAGIRDIVINRDNFREAARAAFGAGYHDCYSDIDLSIKVHLPRNGFVTKDEYMKRIDRYPMTGWLRAFILNIRAEVPISLQFGLAIIKAEVKGKDKWSFIML